MGEDTIIIDQLLSRLHARCVKYGLKIPGPLSFYQTNNSTTDLYAWLLVAFDCTSTDPRDKVFALLSPADESIRPAVLVDYSNSIKEVFTNATSAIIEYEQRLDILRYAS